MKGLKVLSLFDGISCGMVALERAGIPVERYVAYEIDKYAIQVSKKNYPQIEHCGDVTTADFTQYEGFDLLIGGSPCQHWSIARAGNNREITPDGIGGQLFMHYVRALKESKCKYFLYENNYSIHKNIKEFISEQLGVEFIMINSSLVSAQERKRCYWTNIPNITQPKDKKIYLKDVLGIQTEEVAKDRIVMTKSDFDVKVRKHYINTLELSMFLKKKKQESKKTTKQIADECNVKLTKAEHWFRTDTSFAIPDDNVWWNLKKVLNIQEDIYDKKITEFEVKKNSFDMAKRIYNINGKHPTLTTLSGGHQRKTITDGSDLFYLEPMHCERLQTLPDGYTEGISDRQRFKCLGNGWTVDVIAHILSNLKEHTEKENKKMELIMNEVKIPEQITFNYEDIKREVQEKAKEYSVTVYTPEQITEAKKDKATLNKLKKALNDERIRQERAYMQPFNDFKNKINELIKIIDEPVRLIDKQVKEYEENEKAEKRQKITEYWESKEKPFEIPIEKVFEEKWLNKSVSMKSIEGAIDVFVESTEKDLETLAKLPEFAFEALEVYKTTLDINNALNEGRRLADIQKRKREHEAELARKKAEEREMVKGLDGTVYVQDGDKQGFTGCASEQLPGQIGFTDAKSFEECMNPPVEEKQEEVKRQWVAFKANLTTEDAKVLKAFFDSRNIEFKPI